MEFAEQILGPFTTTVRSQSAMRRLSGALYAVTFGRIREVVYWIAFCGGLVVAAVAVGAAVNLGVPISVPLSSSILLFFGLLSASIAANRRRRPRWLITPELDEVVRACAQLEEELRLPETEPRRRAAVARYHVSVQRALRMREGDRQMLAPEEPAPGALRPEDGSG